MVIEIYKAKDGIRWRAKIKKIVADSGEAYANRSSCKRAVDKFIESMKFVQVRDLTQKPDTED